jgi:WD40 repeat protein
LLRNSAILLIVILSAAISGFAEGTRTWEQSNYQDFLKGTAHGVAISSDGFLQLAPAFKLVATTPSSAIWATAIGPQGEIYAATGAPARVYRIVPGGKPVAIFQPQELQVQALAVGKDGTIYAATNPDGKVYKIEPAVAANPTDDGRGARRSNGKDDHAAKQDEHAAKPGDHAKSGSDKTESDWKSSVFFDPGTKYIWSLALDQSGNLYVATGDHGQIFRVSPNGDHSLFFKSDEPHIRVLAFDAQGNVIAGSDGSGLIYRITPKGDGFVLYSAPKREITSLAIDKSGNIYAAAAGEKRGGSGPASVTVAIPPAPKSSDSSAPSAGPGNAPPPAESAVTLNSSSATIPGGSGIYKIALDGSPSLLWNSHDDLVYALAFDSQGHLLAGTGNRGDIFEVGGREDYTELVKAEASQVTAFAKAPNGGLYASTSNLGKIFLLSSAPDAEGSYESDVFDAQVFSKWGRTQFRGLGNVELFARSGNVDNPDRNWSTWTRVDLQKNAEITVPPARFVQWKAILHPGDKAPRVDSVTVNYLQKNVAPEFDDVTVTPGVRYQPVPRPPGLQAGQRFDPQPSPIHDSDSISVKWTARDQNDDQMVYSVYYRGEGQTRWLLLKDNLSEKFYSFDASLLPDGGYTIKVIASDSPSHSPGEALLSERESDRFEVDTTPPQIQDLRASVQGGKIRVQFRAADGFSTIKRAEYSLDAGDWHFVEPVGQLSDAKSENYDFSLPIADDQTAQEHVVVVRAYDHYDNMNSAKTVVPGK